MYKENPFVFSDKYRLLRHTFFWAVHILIFSYLFNVPDQSIWGMLFLSTLWVPAFILYGYPLAYWIVPRFLLKEKFWAFAIILIGWGFAGYLFNYLFRSWVLFPLSDLLHYKTNNRNPWAANSFLSMNVMAGFTCMIVLFKYWMIKQNELMTVEKEKILSEMQLLKAQIHPHFLFNTLNNIYSFSLHNSPKTPQLILKLSSLLSYMLYDCKASMVSLDKEIKIMQDYLDLEKERYGNRLELSINIEVVIHDQYIAPLLLLPFIENAFKHGTAEKLENPWFSLDISVKKKTLYCKIINSKDGSKTIQESGIGIMNVKKRLAYLYPGKHELKINDDGNFFVVTLMLELKDTTEAPSISDPSNNVLTETIHHENQMPVS